ncbi:hypothetical protein [Nocardia wallacei]|uniref:hypothetical protein n=1 Tax=Nocardia wallacei TaxID=480035 RepID=UPI0024587F8E|nr:hypothetical protein [Nocardia wallacei]
MSDRDTGPEKAGAEQTGSAGSNPFAPPLPLLRAGISPAEPPAAMAGEQHADTGDNPAPPPGQEHRGDRLDHAEQQGAQVRWIDAVRRDRAPRHDDTEHLDAARRPPTTTPGSAAAAAVGAGIEEIDVAAYLGADARGYEKPLPPARDDDFDPDVADTQVWKTWRGDDEKTSNDRPPQSGWAIPDTAVAAALVDPSRGAAARRRSQRGRGEPRAARRRRGAALTLSLVAGAGLVVIAGAMLIDAAVLTAGGSSDVGTRPAEVPGYGAPVAPSIGPAPAPPGDAMATAECRDTRGPDFATGTGPGGTADAPSAILAFEHAYYVQRSGAAARAVVTPDANVPSADVIQKGIDRTPDGTRYCTRITPLPVGSGALWRLDLFEQWPGTLPAQFVQTVTVTSQNGRTLITAIVDGSE